MFSPKYQITDKFLNKLTQIAEIKGMVEKSTLLPARESLLKKTAIIKMAHTSTSIEGNLLNEYQVGQVAEGRNVQAEPEQVKEVKNYLSALKKIDTINERDNKITRSDVLDIHKIVVSGLIEAKKSGHFRPSSVYIVNVEPDGREEVAYTPPQSSRVPTLVDELLAWLASEKNIHPVIRAGLFHYQFVTIHPFTDGNGRVGRLLTLLHLYQSGWDFRHSLVLEDYYNRDRKKYYLNLQTGKDYKDRQGVDLTTWLEYFVEGFLVEAINLKEKVLLLASIGGKDIAPQMLDSDELKIVDFVTTVGQTTSSDVMDILDVPKRTAQEKLKRLVDANVLKMMGKGPASFYIVASKAEN